jgi:hypothetical protein
LQTQTASHPYQNIERYQLLKQRQPSSPLLTHLHVSSNNLSTYTAAKESDDPNITILKIFEEPASSQPATAPKTSAESIHASFHGNNARPSKLDQARSQGRDAYLLTHYRSNLSQRVIKVGLQEVEEDIFEIQARTFPPVSFFSRLHVTLVCLLTSFSSFMQ